MDINELTIGQAKELASLFSNSSKNCDPSLNEMIGKFVIVRTYNAGVWFGLLVEKAGKEVILSDARRMYQWWAAESISLSAVALYGIKQDKSKIIEAIPSAWMEAIEILPCSDISKKSLMSAPNVKAQ